MVSLARISACDLSGAIAARQVSAVEVMEATLARIDAVNGPLSAIVGLGDPDTLYAAAKAADAEAPKGWLHGIPIAIKDLANAKGFATSMGSPLFAGQVAEKDDIVVARLRAAGAIVIGKTNTPEFGLGSHTFNPVFGATRNPYASHLSCGGSSGGAAVALAAGMLSIADGSDMMGSLRNPAGWNNVYGMRPSWGLVPTEPRDDTFLHQQSTNGPMARNPRDLAGLLDTMSGADARQPHGLPASQARAGIVAEVAGRRIGWLGDWGGAMPFEAGILELAQAALQQMAELGCQVEDVVAPFSRDALWDSWTGLRSFTIAAGLGAMARNPEQRERIKDTAQWEIDRGLAMSAMELQRLSVLRSSWFRKAASLFEVYDVLAIPTAQVWPFDVDTEYPREISGVGMDTYHRWMEATVPAGLIGLPVVAVPIGFGGPAHTPMGLQLIGKRGSDAALLQLAEAWHQATDWPGQAPPELTV